MATRDRFRRWGAALLVIAPVFVTLDFVCRFSVNVPFWDQWELPVLLEKVFQGQATLDDFFRPHNEHRILFPRLVMVGLAWLTSYDTRVEIFVGWAFMVTTGWLLWREHAGEWGTSTGSLLRFLPVAWVVLSLRQWENLLWGWQQAMFLCSLGQVGAVVSLARLERSRAYFFAAVGCGVLASFSLASGLAVWPACLVWLALRWRWAAGKERTRDARFALGWLVAGAATTAVYVQGYIRPAYHPSPWLFLERPGDFLEYVTAVLGGSLIFEIRMAVAVGGVFLAFLCALTILAILGKVDRRRTLAAAALLLMALGTAVIISIGRVGLGMETALASRYATLTGLGFIGLWRGILAVEPRRIRRTLVWATCALVALGATASLYGGYVVGARTKRNRLEMVEILRDYASRPDAELVRLNPDPTLVRRAAAFLEANDLSVFAQRDGARGQAVPTSSKAAP